MHLAISRLAKGRRIELGQARGEAILHALANHARWTSEVSLRRAEDPHAAIARVRLLEASRGQINQLEVILLAPRLGDKTGLEQGLLVAGPQVLAANVYPDDLGELPATMASALGGVLVRAKWGPKPADKWYLELMTRHPSADDDIFLSLTRNRQRYPQGFFTDGVNKTELTPGEVRTLELAMPPAEGGEVIRFDAWLQELSAPKEAR
jgi:hypothetical protein